MTAAIGAAMAAAVWSIDAGLTMAGLAAGAAGLTSAAAASFLMVRVDRQALAINPEAGPEPAPADLPRLRRSRRERFVQAP
ncbi:hypothetical protein ACQVP2_01935 [Methylobacterium aquaticum]|nr:hypothetical protein [Methylobacterium aquaticum]